MKTAMARIYSAPHGVGTPTQLRLVADWLGLMEPARGETCPSGKRRGSAAPGEDTVISPDQKSVPISTTNSNNLAEDDNGGPPGRYCSARCRNPNHTFWLLIGWGSCSQRAAIVATPGKVKVAPLM